MNDSKDFYEKYKSLVYNLALNYSTNKEDAEEITQDVFLSIFNKMSSFRNKSSIKTWIFRVTINKSLDYLKAKKRFKRNFMYEGVYINQMDQAEYSNINHPGVLLESKEEVQEIFRCINDLSEDYKTVIILLKIENKTYNEVSDIMKISTKAVESLFYRAKNKLDVLLKN